MAKPVVVLAAALLSVIFYSGCTQLRGRNNSVARHETNATDSRSGVLAMEARHPQHEAEETERPSRQDVIRLTALEEDLPEPAQFGNVAVSDSDLSLPAEMGGPAALTLQSLEALALQNNPTLAQAQAGIDVEQGIYRQAGLYPNPQIGYLNGSASNPSVKQSNGVFVSQEFVTARKLTLAQEASAQEVKRLQWDQEAQRMRVLNDLRIRYFEVLGAQEGVTVAKQLVEIAEKSLQVTQKQFEGTHGTRIDVLQAKVQLETLQLSLDDAEQRYTAAWEQLATIAGASPMIPVALVGNLEDDVAQLDLETCWQELLSASPQLRSTESELDHGWAEYHSARAEAIPNVTIQTVAEYDKATHATTVSTLVALPLPIYNRNQGNIDKASADIRSDQAEICRVRLVLRDQLAESFRRYKTSLHQSERLKQSILPKSEESLKLAMQLYTTGETAFAPVLAAQQTYFENRIAYVESLTELHKVVTEINGLQLTGGLNPAAIGSAIQNQPGGTAQRQRALLKEVQERASKQLLPAAQIGR